MLKNHSAVVRLCIFNNRGLCDNRADALRGGARAPQPAFLDEHVKYKASSRANMCAHLHAISTHRLLAPAHFFLPPPPFDFSGISSPLSPYPTVPNPFLPVARSSVSASTRPRHLASTSTNASQMHGFRGSFTCDTHTSAAVRTFGPPVHKMRSNPNLRPPAPHPHPRTSPSRLPALLLFAPASVHHRRVPVPILLRSMIHSVLLMLLPVEYFAHLSGGRPPAPRSPVFTPTSSSRLPAVGRAATSRTRWSLRERVLNFTGLNYSQNTLTFSIPQTTLVRLAEPRPSDWPLNCTAYIGA
ncbi:hypothetical protein C8J57DRAFT_1528491 [Mycena rebaudengoi]|nr:hypothetical protein C8J57DRAFT_1528491 [Mycena rebaudengoi]